MQIFGQGLTHVGQVRSSNQDSIYVDNKRCMYIVADGMGGHAGGEIASQMVVQHFRDLHDHDLPIDHEDRDIQSSLEQQLDQASLSIYLRALESSELKNMGTTCSLVWIYNAKAYCVHVGDSRIYIQRKGFLYQVSNDHSLVAEQIKAGIINEKEAKNHVFKSIITRSVGYRRKEHFDTFFYELCSGDKLLICSDGLHNEVSDIDISKTLSSKQDYPEQVLLDQANESGGKDNISVIIVSVL